MAIDVQSTLDFGGTRKIINLPDGIENQHPVTVAQLNSAIEGLKPKDNCFVATTEDIDLNAAPEFIDGLMPLEGARLLVKTQLLGASNGIYIYHGAGLPLVRSLDANSSRELSQATTTVEYGTSSGITFRQIVSNVILDATVVKWVPFGVTAPQATDIVSGLIELATQEEVNVGEDAARAITPLALKQSPYANHKLDMIIGDSISSVYVITHGFSTLNTQVEVTKNSGSFETVMTGVKRTENTVTIEFDTPQPTNSFKVSIRG